MAPIHDTDVAENRWNDTEWEHYELWERIEARLRRKRRAWIAACAFAFLLVSAIPVVGDRSPKWTGLAATRRLASEINRIKREALAARSAYRIRFMGAGSLNYVVERSRSCADPTGTETVREGSLFPGGEPGFRLLAAAEGDGLSIPGLVEESCFDYLAGSYDVIRNRPVTGFGILPVKDLAEGRSDRLSLLVLTGPSAELNFD